MSNQKDIQISLLKTEIGSLKRQLKHAHDQLKANNIFNIDDEMLSDAFCLKPEGEKEGANNQQLIPNL